MLQIDDAVAAPNPAPPGAPVSRSWQWLAAAVAPFAVLAIWRAFHGMGVQSDDYGQYLMHAEALADGRPYGDINYIYSEYARLIGPRLAPPGLPLILAPFIFLFGTQLAILKTVMLAFGIGLVVVAGLYFSRHVDWKIGLGVALLCAISPDMVHGSSQILTDVPFAALIWLLIYIVDQPGVFTVRRMVAVTLIGAFAVAFRSTGVALGPALVLYAMLRFRDHRLRPLAPVAVWGLGVAALAVFTSVGSASVISLHPRDFYEWIFVEKLPLQSMATYAEHLVASHTYPFPWDRANDVFHLITAALMVVGLVAWVPRAHKSFAFAFALAYGMMLLILPITQPRYLWPLFPVFVFGLLNGIRVIVQLITRAPQLAATGALAFAVVLTPPAMLNVIDEPHPIDLIDVPEARELFDHLRTRSRTEQMRVTFFKPRTLGWRLGIPTMGPPRGEPRCILGELVDREITHVITGSLTGSGENSFLRRAIADRPAWFAKQFGNRTFTLYEFQPGPEALSYQQMPECQNP